MTGGAASPANKACADAFCIALYAGAQAEREICGVEPEGDSTDREHAGNTLERAGCVRGAKYRGDEVWERHKAKLRFKAVSLVRLHRAEIERLAGALRQRVTLSAQEADELIDGKAIEGVLK